MKRKKQLLALAICAVLLVSMCGVVSAKNITNQTAKGYFSDSRANSDKDKGFFNLFPNNQSTFLMSSNIVDPVEDWIDGLGHPVEGLAYADIVSASVTQIDETHLQFEMQMNANIPSDPGHWIAYMWCLDTDRNPDTGNSGFLNNDIGNDAQPQVTYSTTGGWRPYVNILGVSLPPDSFSIFRDTITLTVSLDDIGSPTSFDYMTRTYEEINEAFDVAPNSGHETFIIGSPTVSITTNKFKYTPGDTMAISIDITNPTEDSVTFQWYWGVTQFNVFVPVMSEPVPAGYDDTLDYSFTIPNWGSMPFGNVFYVQLLDVSGEVLDADAACWIYSFTTQDLGVKAANLAEQVVGAPYLWGGKGWNWNPAGGWKWEEGHFVKPENGYPSITGGYYYYSPTTGQVEFGKGLDCSGLSFWAFNKAAATSEYPPSKPLDYECPVYYEGAHDQWTDEERLLQLPKDTPIDELKPGDLLFFDTDKNGQMDHVIMYVGNGDVVHAEGVIYDKIVEEKLDTVLERYEDYFGGYGRVKTVPMERMMPEEIANEIMKTAEEVELLI